MLIDFHVHSNHTPGVKYNIAELANRVKTTGLDGFCLTDMHTVAGVREAKELAGAEGLLALVGFEARTERGHYLVVVPEPERLPELTTWLRTDDQERFAYHSLVEAVEGRDGILVAAHPYDRNVAEAPGDGLVQLDGISAVEVLNATRPRLVNELAEEVATGVGLPAVGGSDARTDLDLVGRFATLVRGPVQDEVDFIDRVRSFDVWPVALGKPAFAAIRGGKRTRRPGEGGRRPARDRPGKKAGDERKPSRPRGRSGGKGKPGKSGAPRHRRSRKPRPPKKDQ